MAHRRAARLGTAAAAGCRRGPHGVSIDVPAPHLGELASVRLGYWNPRISSGRRLARWQREAGDVAYRSQAARPRNGTLLRGVRQAGMLDCLKWTLNTSR
jgi:hypothetical protein